MMISERIQEFKRDIRLSKLNSEEIFQKHMIDADSFFFAHLLKDSVRENKFKTVLSNAFRVDKKEIIIVGSGKLGFSLNPANLFGSFDQKYNRTKKRNHKSDLDVAVVSKELYERIGKSLYNYTQAYSNKWNYNEVYNKGYSKIRFKVPLCYMHFEYFTKGWFRPDYKPLAFDFCDQGTYQELKSELRKLTGRKVGIAIYQNWFYFKDYHLRNIDILSHKSITDTL